MCVTAWLSFADAHSAEALHISSSTALRPSRTSSLGFNEIGGRKARASYELGGVVNAALMLPFKASVQDTRSTVCSLPVLFPAQNVFELSQNMHEADLRRVSDLPMPGTREC
ncbi:hypothetical protein FA95DRAFT_1567321 [Auriscalpium vulgare]|uniref:Uncharacterized protein n=1 Tax=Auriscalpium vulgare TaxID=40419 RepID=A0ACB8R4W5_9AGAM|nr:hypothetical protein FA95DRAFT_1567321 [Auriscalpium vulgare]